MAPLIHLLPCVLLNRTRLESAQRTPDDDGRLSEEPARPTARLRINGAHAAEAPKRVGYLLLHAVGDAYLGKSIEQGRRMMESWEVVMQENNHDFGGLRKIMKRAMI